MKHLYMSALAAAALCALTAVPAMAQTNASTAPTEIRNHVAAPSGTTETPKDKAAAPSTTASAPKDKIAAPVATAVAPKDKAAATSDVGVAPKDKELNEAPSDIRNHSNGTALSAPQPKRIQVVPNPVKDNNFNVVFQAEASTGPIEATVSNLAGEVVWNKLIANNGEGDFNLEVRPQTLPNGYYFVTVVSGNNVQRKKVLVSH